MTPNVRLRVAGIVLGGVWLSGGLGAVQPEPPPAGPPIVRSLITQGRYDEAEAAARNQHQSLGDGPSESRRVESTDLLVETLWRNGRTGPDVLALAEQAVREAEARHGTNSPLVGVSLGNLGLALAGGGDYRRAATVLERRVALLETGLVQQSAVAGALADFGRVLVQDRRYEVAEPIARRALALEASARTLGLSALLLQRRGDYARARPLVERAVALREREPEHPELAGVLGLLGDQWWFEGSVTEADATYRRALAIAERTLRPGHPELAGHLANLATATLEMGDVALTVSLRERATATLEASLGPDHAAIAGSLNDLANAHVVQEDYATARRLYERALAIREQRLGAESDGVATIVFNLGYLAGRLGEVVDVRRQVERAAAIWSKQLGAGHQFVGRAWHLLGQTLLEQNQPSEAAQILTRALSIREGALGPTHPDVADTLGQLAAANGQIGRTREADALSARSVSIWEQAQRPPGLATALLTRANVLREAGRVDAARAAYARALDIGEKVYGPTHRRVAEMQQGLAGAWLDVGDAPRAFNVALEAEATARAHLRTVLRYLPERQATEYSGNRPTGLDIALSVSAGPTAVGVSALLDGVIRGRALVLDELAARRRSVTESDGPDLSALWSELAATRQRLATLAFRSPDSRRPEQYLTLLEAARRAKESAELRLAERSATFRADLAKADAGLDDVKGALTDRSAVVSFVRYTRAALPGTTPALSRPPIPSFAAFVLSKSLEEIVFVQLGPAATIEAAIAAWRTAASQGALRPGAAATGETDYRATGTRLRQLIWDPIAGHVNDATRIFVVPDGALNVVNLAALPAERGRYLIDRSAVIHHLSAERDLMVTPAIAPIGTGLLALGGPTFDSSRSPVVATAALTLRDAGTPCPTFDALRFQTLPGTRQEATEIAHLWGRERSASGAGLGEVDLVVGPDADEAGFKRRAAGHRVLHLATHGFFLGGPCVAQPSGTRAVGGIATARPTSARRVVPAGSPLLLSGLALAGANQRARSKADEDDGILTAEEIAALNLEGTEWAVLSACDTGLGEIRAGEGVFGLRRAFRVAGVRTVIMSLWSVEDQATRQWMRALYEARLERGLDTADSVRAAALSVLNDRRAKGQSTHPFYWAAFVAAGELR